MRSDLSKDSDLTTNVSNEEPFISGIEKLLSLSAQQVSPEIMEAEIERFGLKLLRSAAGHVFRDAKSQHIPREILGEVPWGKEAASHNDLHHLLMYAPANVNGINHGHLIFYRFTEPYSAKELSWLKILANLYAVYLSSQSTTCTDINHQKATALIDQAIDAIISIDQKGIIEAFNPAAEKLFGYHRDEVKGKNIAILMETPIATQHDQFIDNYLTSGKKKGHRARSRSHRPQKRRLDN